MHVEWQQTWWLNAVSKFVQPLSSALAVTASFRTLPSLHFHKGTCLLHSMCTYIDLNVMYISLLQGPPQRFWIWWGSLPLVRSPPALLHPIAHLLPALELLFPASPHPTTHCSATQQSGLLPCGRAPMFHWHKLSCRGWPVLKVCKHTYSMFVTLSPSRGLAVRSQDRTQDCKRRTSPRSPQYASRLNRDFNLCLSGAFLIHSPLDLCILGCEYKFKYRVMVVQRKAEFQRVTLFFTVNWKSVFKLHQTGIFK